MLLLTRLIMVEYGLVFFESRVSWSGIRFGGILDSKRKEGELSVSREKKKNSEEEEGRGRRWEEEEKACWAGPCARG